MIPVPFNILASLIRTAHKYNIPDVLEDALYRLKKFYTCDLATWLNPATRARYVTSENVEDAITAIKLGTLTQTLSVLPTAFLASTRLVEELRDDGDEAASGLLIASLAVPQQAQLIAAKGRLAQVCVKRTLHITGAIPSTYCSSQESCTAVRRNPVNKLIDNLATLVRTFSAADTLRPLHREFWGDGYWRRFCTRCKDALKEADETARRELWLGLPRYLGLEMCERHWPATLAKMWL